MHHRCKTTCLTIILALASAPGRSSAAMPTSSTAETLGCVLRADVTGVINAATADYVDRALRRAVHRNCALLLVIDTPGGTLSATRRIVGSELGASVAVITYVAPVGARAGSAGLFITIAGHLAAMAPATNIGAAHPVVGLGKDPKRAGGEQLARKIESDTAAFARAIAAQRRRNGDWIESAVRESVAATADEAVGLDVIDLRARDIPGLLAAVDGRRLTAAGREVVLATRGVDPERVAMTIQQRARAVLGHPNLAYLLLMVGALGLLLELFHPGWIIPGSVGLCALLLAAIGFDVFPVNLAGVLLIVTALALFILELHVVSYGALTLGGVVALLLGAALLVDREAPDFFADASLRLSWGAVIPLVALVAAATGALAWRATRQRKRPYVTGPEALVGERGQVIEQVGSESGWVRVHGEIWRARADEPIEAGELVEVASVDDLQLRVTPAKRSISDRKPHSSRRRSAPKEARGHV